MKNFLLLLTILLFLPQMIVAQGINVDLQNATYDVNNNQICFDVYMGQGTGYPGGWTGMNLRYDLDMVIASGTPTLGAPIFTNINSTYIDSPPAGSGSQAGSPPAGYEFEYGFGLTRSGGQADLPVSLVRIFSVCIPVVDGTLNGSDPGEDIQMRPAATGTGSSWSGANTTGRQPFNAQDAQEPLPIELLKFEPHTDKCEVSLYWETASEKNLGYFQIEASKDGRDFKAIDQKKPESPNSSSLRAYKYVVPQGYHGFYFRLKAVDLDNASDYSPIVFTETPCAKNYSVQLYPNPNFLSELTIEVNSPEEREQVRFFLLDTFGKRIREQKTDLKEGINKLQLPVDDLPSGTYFIQIMGVEQLSQPLKFVRSNF